MANCNQQKIEQGMDEVELVEVFNKNFLVNAGKYWKHSLSDMNTLQ